MNALLQISLLFVWVSVSYGPQDEWAEANAKTPRFAPETFRQLPQPVIAYLKARKCRVPQTQFQDKPHNVIRGAFLKPGSSDWAVLCSTGKRSVILVFPNGTTESVSETGSTDDLRFLQGAGAGKIKFSRYLSAVDKKAIATYHKEFGGPKLPPLNHQGINDGFLGKASTVRFYHQGRWLELQGAD